jgi:hypothetical protein
MIYIKSALAGIVAVVIAVFLCLLGMSIYLSRIERQTRPLDGTPFL